MSGRSGISSWPPGCILPALLALASALARADEDLPTVENGGAAAADVPADDPFESVDADFGRQVFGTNFGLFKQPRRLERLVDQRIQALDRAYGLSDAQQRKLQLAGRGDVRRALEQLAELRARFRASRGEDAPKMREEMNALRRQFSSGQFDEQSLFARTLAKTLTDEQRARFESRRAQPGTEVITAENAVTLLPLEQLDQDLYRIVWNASGELAAFVTFNEGVEICRLPDFQTVTQVGAGFRPVGFDFSPNRDVVALSDNSKLAVLLNLANGSEIQLDTGNDQPSVAFSPDGTLLATGGYGTSAKLWSVASGALLQELVTGDVEGGLTPVFSPSGRVLAVGHRNSTTRLFDTATGDLLDTVAKAKTQELSFDPQGERLAQTYVDATLRIVDAATGRVLHNERTAAEELYTLDWSPDGSLLATAGLGSQVTLWNTRDWSIVRELDSPEWVICVRFTPDGRRLLVAGGDSAARDTRRVEIWGVP